MYINTTPKRSINQWQTTKRAFFKKEAPS